jgi:hypothetical protein
LVVGVSRTVQGKDKVVDKKTGKLVQLGDRWYVTLQLLTFGTPTTGAPFFETRIRASTLVDMFPRQLENKKAAPR